MQHSHDSLSQLLQRRPRAHVYQLYGLGQRHGGYSRGFVCLKRLLFRHTESEGCNTHPPLSESRPMGLLLLLDL